MTSTTSGTTTNAPATTAPATSPAATSTPAEQVQNRLTEVVSLVKKSVETHDDSLVLRALRRTGWLRKQKLELVRPALLKALAPSKIVAKSVADLLPASSGSMDIESTEPAEEKKEEVSLFYSLHQGICFADDKIC